MARSSGSFSPGRSGNPNGRPKENVHSCGRTLREIAREHTVEAIETLVGIATDEKAPASARVAAASAVLDRGHGKPAQVMADEDGNAVSWIDVIDAARLRYRPAPPETTIQ